MDQNNTRRGLTRNCHPEFISGSTPLVTIQNKEEALNKSVFRAPLRSGFTLIELLVVVLIIGILAAVAVPQYNKAVKKAQGREVLVHLNTLDKIFTENALAHGDICSSNQCFNQAGIDIPTLKYFTFENDGILNHGDTDAFYQSNKGDATITADWNKTTGKRTETRCVGNGCAAYFGCNTITETTCYGDPWDGEEYCPSIQETTSCSL